MLLAVGALALACGAEPPGGPPPGGGGNGGGEADSGTPHVTNHRWADVQNVFATYCVKCHGEPAFSEVIEHWRADKYDAADPVEPVNADLGVFEMRTTIHLRLIEDQSMPPAGNARPPASDLEKISDWIRGGAPR